MNAAAMRVGDDERMRRVIRPTHVHVNRMHFQHFIVGLMSLPMRQQHRPNSYPTRRTSTMTMLHVAIGLAIAAGQGIKARLPPSLVHHKAEGPEVRDDKPFPNPPFSTPPHHP